MGFTLKMENHFSLTLVHSKGSYVEMYCVLSAASDSKGNTASALRQAIHYPLADHPIAALLCRIMRVYMRDPALLGIGHQWLAPALILHSLS